MTGPGNSAHSHACINTGIALPKPAENGPDLLRSYPNSIFFREILTDSIFRSLAHFSIVLLATPSFFAVSSAVNSSIASMKRHLR